MNTYTIETLESGQWVSWGRGNFETREAAYRGGRKLYGSATEGAYWRVVAA